MLQRPQITDLFNVGNFHSYRLIQVNMIMSQHSRYYHNEFRISCSYIPLGFLFTSANSFLPISLYSEVRYVYTTVQPSFKRKNRIAMVSSTNWQRIEEKHRLRTKCDGLSFMFCTFPFISFPEHAAFLSLVRKTAIYSQRSICRVLIV